MAGLLDYMNTPEGMGLLSAVAGGLAGARRGAPLNNLGRAGLAGLQGYAAAQDQARQQQDLDWQKEARQRQRAEWGKQDQIDGLAKQYYTPATPDVPAGNGLSGQPSAAIPGQAARFDLDGYSTALMGLDPARGVAMQQALAKDSPFSKVDAKDYTPESVARFATSRNFGDLVPRVKMEVQEGVAFDPYNIKAGTVLPNPNKPFTLGAGGEIVPNAQYQAYELGRARAGAPKTSVKVENKMGESIANQIGPMVKDTWTAANGAVQTADAANRVIQAVDGGRVVAGPLANERLKAKQFAQLLGVGGKDDAELIANTRQAMNGLAQMTLQGRKQMSGQGAITESESKLAERAISGDITMTAAEIKQLAGAARRAARFTYDQHASQVDNMSQDPNLAGMAKFYRAAPFPEASSDQSGGPQVVRSGLYGGRRVEMLSDGSMRYAK